MPSLSERLNVHPPCDTCRCATFIHGDPFCELTNGIVDCPHLNTAEREVMDEYARTRKLVTNPGIDEKLEKALKSLKNRDS